MNGGSRVCGERPGKIGVVEIKRKNRRRNKRQLRIEGRGYRADGTEATEYLETLAGMIDV